MRRLIITILAAVSITIALPCCISCNPQSKPEEETKEPEKETSTLKPGSFKFTVSPLKGKWEAGDKIYVHGSYGPKAQIVTLAAADISADGKTASANLDEVTEFPYDPDGLYAAWPADSVEPTDGLQSTYTTFTDCMRLLGIAYLQGDTFQFADASCAIKFKVSGYDKFIIASNTSEGMCLTGYDVDYSSTSKSFDMIKDDGYPFREQQAVSGENTIWIPGNKTFQEGFTLYLGKGNDWPYIYKVSEKTDIAAGTVLDLGDISSKLTSYTGPAPRLPRMGKSTKYTVKFNELSGICLSADEDFLWGVGDNGDLAKISFEGQLLENKRSIGGDTEAISMDPVTKDLLIGLEDGYQGLGRIAAPNYTGTMQKVFKIAAAKNFGNAGVEGLTYYKDGLVYLGTQQNSELFLCNLETGEVLMDKQLYDRKRVSEIADLCYDPLTDWLWIIDSEAKKIFIFSGNMETYMGAYPVGNISNPESVCVDHKHGCVWVGDDYGSTSYLYKFEFPDLDDFNIQ